MSTRTIVLVHGAWCGGWYWQEIADLLRELGLRVHVVEKLPSSSGNAELGLAADAAYLRNTVETLGGTVTLVGHSYGGMAISQLAGDPSVASAIYLTAFLPQQGQSFIDAAGGKLARWIEVDVASGLTRIAESAAPKIVTSGMSEVESQQVISRLSSQSLLSFSEQSIGTDWGDTPITCIVCTEDRVIPDQVQRSMAAHAQNLTTAEVASGHFPMFTAVRETADAIAAAARA